MEKEQTRISRCGNCIHLFPLKPRKDKNGNPEPIPNYLHRGKCECNGKTMAGSLVAGCHFWAERK